MSNLKVSHNAHVEGGVRHNPASGEKTRRRAVRPRPHDARLPPPAQPGRGWDEASTGRRRAWAAKPLPRGPTGGSRVNRSACRPAGAGPPERVCFLYLQKLYLNRTC